jgi:broad specificity phosphatase PhoE
MRTIEHYRHAMRLANGLHLSPAGLSLARRVGEGLGSFDKVVTSEIPRAVETANAMGYDIDEQVEILGSLVLADQEVDWQAGIAALAEAYRLNGQAMVAAQTHASMLRYQLSTIPEDGRILMISHGGVIELGVVGVLPDYDYSAWGPACGFCEGVRMYFEGTNCVRAELLRLKGRS